MNRIEESNMRNRLDAVMRANPLLTQPQAAALIVQCDATARAIAENWHNTTPLRGMIEWATARDIKIGQNGAEGWRDWNERVINAYAAELA